MSTMILGASLVASTSYSQVYVRAHINLGIPAPRVYCTPAPAQVAYEEGYAPDPYAAAPVVVNEAYYPDAAFYTYPAWNGHYRDRIYFDHYRPFFERDHARFDRGHERFDRDRGRFDGDRGRDHGRDSDRHYDHIRR
jgi:hypothetical protein